ncbi:hypothetical protein Ancab_016607 [Ancistrocladus abbreviatus]
MSNLIPILAVGKRTNPIEFDFMIPISSRNHRTNVGQVPKLTQWHRFSISVPLEFASFRTQIGRFQPSTFRPSSQLPGKLSREILNQRETEGQASNTATMNFKCSDVNVWEEALSSYPTHLASLNKPNLVPLDEFYRTQLPFLLRSRQPTPYLTRSDLFSLMQWKLTRGKFRPRLLNFISSLEEDLVKSASEKAFLSLPDLAKAVSELTVLKGVGPATASAVLAAYAPDVAPFMSDEAMEVVLGDSKDYSLKRYLVLADKLQTKAKELTSEDRVFTASDVERAIWSSIVGAKLVKPARNVESDVNSKTISRRKRKKLS